MIPLLFQKPYAQLVRQVIFIVPKHFYTLKIEFFSCCSQNYIHYCICLSLSTTKNARMCLHWPLGHPSETHANYITFLLQEEVKINYAGQCTKYNNRFQSCEPKIPNQRNLVQLTHLFLSWLFTLQKVFLQKKNLSISSPTFLKKKEWLKVNQT